MGRSLVRAAMATVVACLLLRGGPAAAAPPAPAIAAAQRATLDTSCGKCHGAEDPQGGFRLDTLPAAIDTVAAADRWQKVLGVMNAGEMPPEGEPPLDPVVKTELLDDLARALVAARKLLADSGGGATLRRLNRREYGNTLRDLLGVEVDVRELPADAGGGFDTIGSTLFMSADQIEQYHALALQALSAAFKRYGARHERRTLHREPETEINPRLTQHVQATIGYHKQFHRWTKAVEAAAERPENKPVVAELTARKPDRQGSLRHGWQRIAGAPSPEEFGFADAVAAEHHGTMWRSYGLYRTMYLTMPGTATGAYLSIRDAYVNENYAIALGSDWPPGRYLLRLRIAATDEAPTRRRCIEYGWRDREIAIVGCREVSGTMQEPQILEIPIDVPDLPRGAIVVREKGLQDVDGKPHRVFDQGLRENGAGLDFAIWIDWAEVEGPVDLGVPPPAVAEVLAATQPRPAAAAQPAAAQPAASQPAASQPAASQPAASQPAASQPAAAPPPQPDTRGLIARFAGRAFRGREPDAAFLDRLVAIFERRRAAGLPVREAILEPLAIVLSAPHFLYLAEPATQPTADPATDQASANPPRRPLTGIELATRLSSFLHGGPPDDVLLDRARAGDLARPDALAAEVGRLLADPRSRRFTDPFTHQWLGLDRLDFFQFNDTLHPDFDLATKSLARQEVLETVALLVRENMSLRRLLASDFVVVNGILARYYGLEGVRGDDFRKVSLPPGSPRGGLLGMAAVLAMGSDGEHSSPVERGAWVLRKLLHDPPPPAPPNVPQLARLDGRLLTTRERLLAHQEQPQCASCHRRIDPIGFGLENFDAAGRWRTEDSRSAAGLGTKTWAIEPAGRLHGGPEFADYFALKGIVAGRIDDFSRGFTEALLEYALGRPCGTADEPLRDAIVRRAAAEDHAVPAFIRGVVESDAFRTK